MVAVVCRSSQYLKGASPSSLKQVAGRNLAQESNFPFPEVEVRIRL